MGLDGTGLDPAIEVQQSDADAYRAQQRTRRTKLATWSCPEFLSLPHCLFYLIVGKKRGRSPEKNATVVPTWMLHEAMQPLFGISGAPFIHSFIHSFN